MVCFKLPTEIFSEWVIRGVEQEKDYSFITDRTTARAPRIIEHPADSSCYFTEYRFCHPNAPRCKITNATFKELKDALNSWIPYGIKSYSLPSKSCVISNNVSFDIEESISILERSLLKEDNIKDMILIKASENDARTCMKTVIFDLKKQIFLFRTCSLIKSHPHISDLIISKPQNISHNPEWGVYVSTLLAGDTFWSELKIIINSM